MKKKTTTVARNGGKSKPAKKIAAPQALQNLGVSLSKQFILGSHLCRTPMPPLDELLADMEILKR